MCKLAYIIVTKHWGLNVFLLSLLLQKLPQLLLPLSDVPNYIFVFLSL